MEGNSWNGEALKKFIGRLCSLGETTHEGDILIKAVREVEVTSCSISRHPVFVCPTSSIEGKSYIIVREIGPIHKAGHGQSKEPRDGSVGGAGTLQGGADTFL